MISLAFYGTVVILLGGVRTAGNTFSNSCLVDERVWLESENGAAVKFIACILIEADMTRHDVQIPEQTLERLLKPMHA